MCWDFAFCIFSKCDCVDSYLWCYWRLWAGAHVRSCVCLCRVLVREKESPRYRLFSFFFCYPLCSILTTGVATCGSGVGAFILAPLIRYLEDINGWKGVNIVLAGFCLQCAVFGATMRPLKKEYSKHSHNRKD